MTENYATGTMLLAAGRTEDAIAVLSAEPADSPCYGLAFAQAAIHRLMSGEYSEAIAAAQVALAAFEANGYPFPPLAVVARRTWGDALSHSECPLQSLDHYVAAVALAETLAAAQPAFANFLEQEEAITLTHLAGACNRLEYFLAGVEHATTARDILKKHPDIAPRALPYALENLAFAYGKTERPDPAGYAIHEALNCPGLDAEQRVRLELAKVQLLKPPTAEAQPLVQRAIDKALADQRWELATLRCGIGIRAALVNNDPAWAQDLFRQADTLDPRLAANSLWPARLQFYRAELLKMIGAQSAEIRKVLGVGAHHWCTRTGGRGELPDYQFMVGLMADHFRLLARTCLDTGRNEEAFVAFEMGRGRAVVAEMRNNLTHPLVANSPFNADGEISLAPLRRIQETLGADEVIVCLASVPPNTAFFVVGRTRLEVLEIETPVQIEYGIRLIPSALAGGKGVRAIPELIQDMARRLVPVIAGRKVRALIPYRIFHLVPWRALLRHVGLEWDKLGFGVSFSPALQVRHRIDILACGAIAHGAAGDIDLNEEAEKFAAEFGAKGKVTRDARKADFRKALGEPAVALISCHGHLVTGGLGPKVNFALADGHVTLEEVLPEQLRCPLVILSACDSGAYDTLGGDYPIGPAPSIVLRGSAYCACTRFPIRAEFARNFFPRFGRKLAGGMLPEAALAEASDEFHTSEDALWRDLACVEFLVRGD